MDVSNPEVCQASGQ